MAGVKVHKPPPRHKYYRCSNCAHVQTIKTNASEGHCCWEVCEQCSGEELNLATGRYFSGSDMLHREFFFEREVGVTDKHDRN